MLNVDFIFPSSDYLYDPFRGDPHTHFQILTILDNHFSSKIKTRLTDLRGIKRESAIQHIPESDVYLHSVYTLDYDEQVSIVKNLRERYPKAKHIAGGPHVHAFQKQSLEIFDSLILGDGEKTIVQALNELDNLKPRYIQQEPININDYPIPRRDFLPKESIVHNKMIEVKAKPETENIKSTTAVFGRGCPYNCTFCAMPDVKKYNPGIRYKNPDLVKKEIEYLQRAYGLDGLAILDEIGVPIGKRAIPYLEAIAETGIKWKGQCRVDGLTAETTKLMKESNCLSMGVGVESVNQESLDAINKKIDLNQVRRVTNLLKQNDIEVRYYVILGLPKEPEDIVERTWDFLQETRPAKVYLSLLTIRPGTILCQNPEKFGIKNITSDWSKTMHMFSRYSDEKPTMTFEYEKGAGLPKEQIIRNYLDLQSRIQESEFR